MNRGDQAENISAGAAAGEDLDARDMRRLVAGNDSALGELMSRHGEKLFHYLLRSLQNEEDAADLAQETFARVYQSRDRFDAKQRFSTWLYAIASNLVRDRFRWRNRHPQVSLNAETAEGESELGDHFADERPIPAEVALREERGETVRRAIANLPEELRLPLILVEYEEKSQAEIAEILGCSIKAVETRLYRARQKLRTELRPLLEA